jgi:pilus assembly protein CpaE
VASYLGLEGQYGLADVLVSRSRIDRHLITSTAVPYSEQLQVLLSPVSIDPANPAQLVYPHLGDALHACKRAYRFTVVDAPRVAMDVAVSLADGSQVTPIVFQLAVKDIRAARSTVRILTERGIPAARIVPLVNRYRKRRSTVTLEEARAAMGGVPLRCVHNDFRRASLAIDYGQPLAQAAPRSVLRRDLSRLAAALIEARTQGIAIATS